MNIFALLVGINQYDHHSNIPPLRGCVNDVKAMQAYLEGRLNPTNGQLHLKTLINEQATRNAIIHEGFRQHLSQAGANDVALFFYAGHGAQENAPEEFWHLEPDHMNETLVCHDSRCEGSWDIADKELAQLIAEVAEKNPHIVVILDCCHSGSGTRGELEATASVRRAPVDVRKRPVDTFIVSPEELPTIPNSTTRSINSRTSHWQPPQGRHILMSACRDIEEAKEIAGEGQHRGAFAYFLLESLHSASDRLTYRDIFKRASSLVQSRIAAQTPQLEANHTDDLDQPFLGGAIQPRASHFTVSHHLKYGWIIDGGYIHGLTNPTAKETTLLSLFPFNTTDDSLQNSDQADSAQAVGTATVTTVMPGLSQIDIQGIDDLQPDTTFKAVVTAMPLPPMGVLINGEATGCDLLKQAIATPHGQQQPSLYIKSVDSSAAATFQVLCQNGKYHIKRPTDDRILVNPLPKDGTGYQTNTATTIVQQLERLARWTKTLELKSSLTSRIPTDAIQLQITHHNAPSNQPLTENQPTEAQATENHIRLTYAPDGTPPSFTLTLKNTSDRQLFCSLVNLTDRFSIAAPFFESGGIWLGPQEEKPVLGGEPIEATVPDQFLQQNITEYKDVLKLIVSTSEFDARLLEQPGLDLPQTQTSTATTRAIDTEQTGMLNQLLGRIQTRDLGAKSKSNAADDWLTSQITITTIHPKETVPISAESPTDLKANVTLLAHDTLKGQARLTTVNQSTRDLGNHILPPLLRDHTQAFQFTPSRATDPGLSALELKQINNRAAVTPTNPLKLTASTPLEKGAYILPVAYDGEFYLPLGRGISKQGHTEITIDHLPEPISEGNRSLGGSIRIFFQKIVTKKLGPELSRQLNLTFEYPILAAVNITNGELQYEADPTVVSEKVAKANRIALYIHGIIGDTQSMVPSIESALATLEGQTKPLKECYDLILTFDYESLNTPVPNHARALKKRLQDTGLGPDHGKTLHIIAHSMGGLVARWFIEQEQGNRIVQHLVLLGTPSAGSPWPQVQAGLTTLASLIINGLSTVALPMKVLGLLLEKIEEIDVTLDDMEPNSEFLQELAASEDPGIPYTVIAGNTSLITSTPDTLAGKLVARIKHLMELPFFGEPNDLAVTVKSIKAIPPGRTPAPLITEVDCDHLVYFTDKAGVNSLGTAIQQIFAPSTTTFPPVTTSSTHHESSNDEPVKNEPVKNESPASQTAPPTVTSASTSPHPQKHPSKIAWIGWVIGLIAAVLIGAIGWKMLSQQTAPDSQESSLEEILERNKKLGNKKAGNKKAG